MRSKICCLDPMNHLPSSETGPFKTPLGGWSLFLEKMLCGVPMVQKRQIGASSYLVDSLL